MNEERLLKVLLAPHITEKSASMSSGGYPQYAFKVRTDANKIEIKKAVEHLFKVPVRSVCVTHVKGKATRVGRIQGRRKDWKKAYVMLAKGAEIDITTM